MPPRKGIRKFATSPQPSPPLAAERETNSCAQTVASRFWPKHILAIRATSGRAKDGFRTVDQSIDLRYCGRARFQTVYFSMMTHFLSVTQTLNMRRPRAIQSKRMNSLSRLVLAALVCGGVIANISAAPPVGIKPAAKDGRALNLDFEDGTLRDWVATGDAFDQQPIMGDTVSKRRSDMKSGHQGQYWIGTFEVKGDAPQGTLTSIRFKVTQPFASFLVGGGSGPGTRVELVDA